MKSKKSNSQTRLGSRSSGHWDLFPSDNTYKNQKGGLLKKMNNRGFVGLMVGVMFAFLVVTTLMMLLPAFVDMVDFGRGSDSLNCRGYVDYDLSDGNQSYNATIGTKSKIGCLALTLYIPYLVLAILIAIVSKLFYDRSSGQ